MRGARRVSLHCPGGRREGPREVSLCQPSYIHSLPPPLPLGKWVGGRLCTLSHPQMKTVEGLDMYGPPPSVGRAALVSFNDKQGGVCRGVLMLAEVPQAEHDGLITERWLGG